MVKSNAVRLDSIFHALSDSTRRSILREVSSKPKTVGEIAKPYAMSLAAVSKHLKVLEAAELIARERRGGFHVRCFSEGWHPPATIGCSTHTPTLYPYRCIPP